MFKNINKFLSSRTPRMRTIDQKFINGNVRTFSTSTPRISSSSPLIKAFSYSGLILGVGYVLNNLPDSTKLIEKNKKENSMHPDVKKHLKKVYGYTAFNIGLTGLTSYCAIKSGMINIILKPYNQFWLTSGSFLMFLLTYVLDTKKEKYAKHASLVALSVLNGLSYPFLVYSKNGIHHATKHAFYVLSIFAALSYVSATSKKGKDKWIEGVFYCGLPTVLMLLICSVALPNKKTSLNYINISYSLFACIYLLNYTKEMVRDVETYQDNKSVKEPDHINNSLMLNICNSVLQICI